MKLGIIGAMTIEVNLLKKEIENLKIDKEGAFEFYSGTINGIEVTVLLSGIGKVSAAVGTSLLIERYQPSYIINTGTAGGLHNVKMGDLVIGDEVGYHDADLTAFGYELGQMAQQPAYFKANEYLLQIVLKAVQKLPVEQNILQGIILSGDSFMSDVERVDQVRNDFSKALAVDMESAAIGQTCKQLNVPFVVVRAISDMAGEGDSKSYDTFVERAGNISAKMIVNCIEIIKNGKNS
ncbi:adenosylhomocysteine nucleosidase [Flavobacteriaceae bacterium UJ101]|nr:adenosylhomocysteine nucleosidase [Flavobacteriaceae bacterium UJ101]